MNLSDFKFNCLMPSGEDWKQYDGIEIAGCVQHETEIEPIDGEPDVRPDIVSVYLHCAWGGVECIHDFEPNEYDKALELADALLFKYPQLRKHGICDRYCYEGEAA